MNKVKVRAKSLDLALIKASGELAVSRKDVAHKVLEEKSGFCGFGRQVIIEAWHQKAPKSKSVVGRSRHGKKQKRELPEEQLSALQQELKEYLAAILRQAFLVDDEITIEWSHEMRDQRMIFNVDSQKVASLLEENLKLAEALEHLLRKKPRHLKRELPFKIFFDACSYRQQREQELRELAFKLSEQAVESAQSVVMDCETSQDRKAVHQALHQDRRVRTKSVGKGERRKLIIVPNSPRKSSS